MNYFLHKHKSFEDFKKNVERQCKEAVSMGSELLLFPEYGSIELVSLMDHWTQKNLAKQLDEIQKYRNDFLQIFIEQAKKLKVLIVTPSFPWKIENGEIRNRAYVVYPNGDHDYQEKSMMTRFENEEWHVKRGDQNQKVFEYKTISFGINICYDIEFPDYAREMCRLGAKLILVPSCTETAKGMNRVHVGARARALENQCYVVVSQTIGDVDYSEAIDKNTGRVGFYSTCDTGFPDDGILHLSEVNVEGWSYVELDFDLIDKVRSSGAVFNFNDIKNL